MDRFIAIYDGSAAFVLTGKSLGEQYAELGIDEKFSFTRHRVDDEIVSRVFNCIKYDAGEYIGKGELSQIKKALIYKSVLEHTEQYEAYILALEELDSIGGNNVQKYAPLSEEDKWKEAIGYLKCYMKRNPPQTEFVKDCRKKEIDRAKAALKLQKHGVRVRIEKNDLAFDKTYAVTGKISDMVSRIGGVRFVEALLAPFPFNADTGRLKPLKQGNTPNPFEAGSDYPFGYLLNLGLRHTSSKGSEESLKKYFVQVFELAQDYCTAVYPVVNHHILADIFHRGEKPTAYLKRLTILDSIYYVQQNNKELAIAIYGYLIDRLETEGYELPEEGITLQEYKAVMTELMRLTDDKKFVRVRTDDIKTLPDEEKKKRFFRTVSISAGVVNPNYEEPLDYDKVNYSDAPMILLPNGEALLYPSTIGVGGWYEKMMALLREKYNDRKTKSEMDGFVGLELEGFMRQKFAEKGIAVKHGKYKYGKSEGECDLVVESDDKIFLMEMKKKNLTRASRQGNEYQIVLDLAGSLLYSQDQCFRTKMVLMKEGQVELEENGNKEMLEYKGRKTEHITLTLNDYGSMQERLLLKQILEIFMRYEFSVKDEDVDATHLDAQIKQMVKEGYVTLAKKQKQLKGFLDEICKMELLNTPQTKQFRYDPFFDSWFLNIEQLCYLLKISNNISEFEENVKNLKFTTYGTRDFWAELPLKLNTQN